jgi:molybdopterin-guanine dinucleotide biosynthesis protein A
VSPSEVVGFAVAGGRSRRMGRDKALLEWKGGTLLDHAIGRLRAVCDEVHVLSGPERRYAALGLPVDVDERPEGGPLAGLAAALAAAAPRAALLLGIDIPFATVDLLAHIRDAVAGWDAAVPAHERGQEPLCAAYAASCLDPVREALAARELKMTSFWPRVRVRVLDSADLARFGPADRLFHNLNAPADYATARADRG